MTRLNEATFHLELLEGEDWLDAALRVAQASGCDALEEIRAAYAVHLESEPPKAAAICALLEQDIVPLALEEC